MSSRFLSTAMVLALSPALFSAEEPADLTKLREGYQKALTEVAVPVRARYVEKLQALMKVCTQRGDLDGAVKVRQEFESLKVEATAAAASGVDGTRVLRAALEGSTWTWERNGAATTHITFMPNGRLKNPIWGGVFKWRLSGEGVVTLDNEEVGTAKLTFNKELTSFEAADFRTGDPIKGRPVSSGSKASGGSGGSSGGAFGKPEK